MPADPDVTCDSCGAPATCYDAWGQWCDEHVGDADVLAEADREMSDEAQAQAREPVMPADPDVSALRALGVAWCTEAQFEALLVQLERLEQERDSWKAVAKAMADDIRQKRTKDSDH